MECTHCHAEINELKFSRFHYVREYVYGRCSLGRTHRGEAYIDEGGEDYEMSDDTQDESETTYSCPECEHEFDEGDALEILRNGEPSLLPPEAPPEEEPVTVTMIGADPHPIGIDWEGLTAAGLAPTIERMGIWTGVPATIIDPEAPVINRGFLLQLPPENTSMQTCPGCKGTRRYSNKPSYNCPDCGVNFEPSGSR